MGLDHQIPLEKFHQDPNTGLWRFGSIEMTSAEYTILYELDAIRREMISLKERITKIEGK